MRTDTAEDAPAELVQYAKGIFRSKVVKHGPSLLRLIVASLTFDSLTTAPALTYPVVPDYSPSWVEWAAVLGIASGVLLIFIQN